MKLEMLINGISTSSLGLHLNPLFEIEAPLPKTYVVNPPFADGKIDLSESLTNDVVYENRNVSFTLEKLRPKNMWFKTYSEFLQKFNGKKVKLRVPYDDTHYFLGRLTASPMIRGVQMTFKVSVDCDPYRYKNEITKETVNVNGTHLLKLKNEGMKTIPTLTTSASVVVKYKNQSLSLNKGTHILPFILVAGENENMLEGTATVTIQYQEGVL